MPPYMFLDSRSSTSLFCTMEPHYPVHYQKLESHQYWFVSVGKRNVIKCVQFSILDAHSKLYNLSLMDLDLHLNMLSDNAITDNGDTIRILRTVAFCVQVFLNKEENTKVYFVGNSPARNRLYRMYIYNYQYLWDEFFLCECNKKSDVEFGFYFTKK